MYTRNAYVSCICSVFPFVLPSFSFSSLFPVHSLPSYPCSPPYLLSFLFTSSTASLSSLSQQDFRPTVSLFPLTPISFRLPPPLSFTSFSQPFTSSSPPPTSFSLFSHSLIPFSHCPPYKSQLSHFYLPFVSSLSLLLPFSLFS